MAGAARADALAASSFISGSSTANPTRVKAAPTLQNQSGGINFVPYPVIRPIVSMPHDPPLAPSVSISARRWILASPFTKPTALPN